MKDFLVAILFVCSMVVLPGWVVNNPIDYKLKQEHDMKSVHPHDYYSIVFMDTLSMVTIQKLAGETIQKFPQYDSIIINRFLAVSPVKQEYTVSNKHGTVTFIFHFFSRHMALDNKRSITCVYDSTNQNISHLGEWVH